jgi:hypothetical protein
MQTPQEILATAKKYGVPLPETCIELEWENETLFYWFAFNNEFRLTRNEFGFPDTFSVNYNLIENEKITNKRNIPAPQMHEIFRCFSQIQLVTTKEYLWVSYVKYPIHIPIHDHHYAQSYAELFIKLKEKNLLCKS